MTHLHSEEDITWKWKTHRGKWTSQLPCHFHSLPCALVTRAIPLPSAASRRPGPVASSLGRLGLSLCMDLPARTRAPRVPRRFNTLVLQLHGHLSRCSESRSHMQERGSGRAAIDSQLRMDLSFYGVLTCFNIRLLHLAKPECDCHGLLSTLTHHSLVHLDESDNSVTLSVDQRENGEIV